MSFLVPPRLRWRPFIALRHCSSMALIFIWKCFFAWKAKVVNDASKILNVSFLIVWSLRFSNIFVLPPYLLTWVNDLFWYPNETIQKCTQIWNWMRDFYDEKNKPSFICMRVFERSYFKRSVRRPQLITYYDFIASSDHEIF